MRKILLLDKAGEGSSNPNFKFKQFTNGGNIIADV